MPKPIPGKEQPFGPWTDDEACRSRAHCASCQGNETGFEDFRARIAVLWEPPADWKCPYGVKAEQIEAERSARVEAALKATAEAWDWHYGHLLDGKTDVQQVEALAKCVRRGSMSQEVAERIATGRGINLDA